jgi:hypothetical protein
MESSRLEQLEQGLRNVLRLIERDETGQSGELAREQCEVMLPEPLTLAALSETVRHKIDTVQVLLTRAREHEQLQPDAQLAADEGYMVSNDELADAKAAQKG